MVCDIMHMAESECLVNAPLRTIDARSKHSLYVEYSGSVGDGMRSSARLLPPGTAGGLKYRARNADGHRRPVDVRPWAPSFRQRTIAPARREASPDWRYALAWGSYWASAALVWSCFLTAWIMLQSHFATSTKVTIRARNIHVAEGTGTAAWKVLALHDRGMPLRSLRAHRSGDRRSPTAWISLSLDCCAACRADCDLPACSLASN